MFVPKSWTPKEKFGETKINEREVRENKERDAYKNNRLAFLLYKTTLRRGFERVKIQTQYI